MNTKLLCAISAGAGLLVGAYIRRPDKDLQTYISAGFLVNSYATNNVLSIGLAKNFNTIILTWDGPIRLCSLSAEPTQPTGSVAAIKLCELFYDQ